MKQTPKEVL